jgi:hypothetical protein
MVSDIWGFPRSLNDVLFIRDDGDVNQSRGSRARRAPQATDRLRTIGEFSVEVPVLRAPATINSETATRMAAVKVRATTITGVFIDNSLQRMIGTPV